MPLRPLVDTVDVRRLNGLVPDRAFQFIERPAPPNNSGPVLNFEHSQAVPARVVPQPPAHCLGVYSESLTHPTDPNANATALNVNDYSIPYPTW